MPDENIPEFVSDLAHYERSLFIEVLKKISNTCLLTAAALHNFDDREAAGQLAQVKNLIYGHLPSLAEILVRGYDKAAEGEEEFPEFIGDAE